MGSELDACVDDDRLVLSEVHIGRSASDEEAEVVSRYAYLVPSDKTGDNDSSSISDSSISDSDSEGDTTDRGGGGGGSRGSCSSPTRRRKRSRTETSSTTSSQRRSRPAHEVLTIVHRMATPLGLVGQQVWSAAFLLGDFVLTHPKIFAGVQVGVISVSVRGLAFGGWARTAGRCCPSGGLDHERESYNRTRTLFDLSTQTSSTSTRFSCMTRWVHSRRTRRTGRFSLLCGCGVNAPIGWVPRLYSRNGVADLARP